MNSCIKGFLAYKGPFVSTVKISLAATFPLGQTDQQAAETELQQEGELASQP